MNARHPTAEATAQTGSSIGPQVGRAVPHESAVGHVTGRADYIGDLPHVAGELAVHFAGSPVPHGRIKHVDASEAAAMAGVHAVYTADDIDGVNAFGPIFHNEVFLAHDEVSYLGQPVVVVAAVDRETAVEASKRVRIEVEASPPVLTIEQARERDDTIGPTRRIERGDEAAAYDDAPHTLSGVFRSGGQEQFYFESQSCLTVPDEFGCLTVHSSTQHTTEIQAFVAEVLGLSMQQVVCICRRMGGAFGGKESQSAIPALMASIVALKTGRPARVVYDKHTDMLVTGKRHEYRTDYRVGFDDDGRLRSLRLDYFSNGGAFADLSTAVMERSMMHSDNAYHIPNVDIRGTVCRTNLPPNTAFRGFGGPQAVALIENILQDVATTLGLDALDVRRRNLYVDGDPDRSVTPYGQVVRDHVLVETFDELERTSDYRRRRQAIAAFNADSPTHRRGLAMTGIKFGISFTTKFLNQGNALVNVYTDGTVQVSTGGTEMGQGLNTKIRQLVADVFGLPVDDVRVMPTSTEKNNNTSPTAASAGTDLNGSAAVLAAEKIRARLDRFAATLDENGVPAIVDAGGTGREAIELDEHQPDENADDMPRHNLTFAQLCDAARRNRVDLGERAFYATPGVEFDRETGRGTPFHYYTTGAAVAEVDVDRFTGDVRVRRVDLLMDIGQRINPGIDDGQVIGGFVQGMGWCTTEALVYRDGELLSTGPTTYKIPDVTDVPEEFNVDYIDNPKHAVTVGRSKAVGEPPLMLGISVWAAVKDAVQSFRPGEPIELALPATGEATLTALESAAGVPSTKGTGRSESGQPVA